LRRDNDDRLMISNQEGSRDGVCLQTPGQGVGGTCQQTSIVVDQVAIVVFGLTRTRFAVFHTQKPRERDEAKHFEPHRR
jgi:hypothetical protein